MIHDEIFAESKPIGNFKNPTDVLTDLIHNMCYLFGRATKAVSICPPAYYADILCERARIYNSDIYDSHTESGSVTGGGTATIPVDSNRIKIHDNLKDTMFYI